MRIGVLTYHCVPNFGAQLQCISTVGYLKNIGHEPVVLNWYPQDLEDMYSRRISCEQVAEHNKFAKQNMPLSCLCRTEEDLIAEVERLNLDAVLAGSDALFKYVPESKRVSFSKKKLRFVKRKLLTVEKIKGNVFFGEFLSKLPKKIKAVAFSVSSQNCNFSKMNDMEKIAMEVALDNYAKISVRDDWTKKMVQTVTGRSDVDVTPDPVFAFNQNNYLSLPSKKEICDKYSLPEKYVLISFWTKYLKKDYIQGLARELQKNGLTPVAFPMPEHLIHFDLDCKINLPLSPLDWYALIKYSHGYIGERMHPIVVCLHNSVPFFCFDEYGTFKKTFFGLRKKYIQSSSKTYHILENAGLGEWLYSYLDEKTELPGSVDVVRKFMQFPVQECQKFAERTLNRYNQGMKTILEILNA